ncbi:MAG: hypothetical protein NZ949_05150, partial [Candidatus Kapabacteria bacterium]|nr:hypothetical protein [Candidatus Kapabacteria bacterium]MDW7996107.1 hypothetical protein [Bacteroidota bacterium]
HAVYTYNAGPNAGHVAYLRSTDQGQRWSEEVILSGAPPPILGSEHYAVEAGGGKVVVAYYSFPAPYAAGGIVLRISLDNGNTWSDPVGLFPGRFERRYEDSTVTRGNDTVRTTTLYFHTDTVTSVDNFSLFVDHQGRWHLIATLVGGFLRGEIVTTDTLLPEPRQSVDTTYSFVVAAAYPVLVYAMEGTEVPVLVLLPEPAVDHRGRLVQVVHPVVHGYVDRIKLGMDDEGKLYAVFTAPRAGDTVRIEGDTVTYGYGHVWVTVKLGDTTWTVPHNITPDGVDCNFPTASRGGPAGYALLVYQAGSVPGSFVLGAPWAPGTEDEIYVLAYALPTSVRESRKPAGVEFRVAPNPIGEMGYIQLVGTEPGWASLSLYTPLGNRLRTLYEGWLDTNEGRMVQLNAAELPSGVYYLMLSFNGSSAVRQIVVVR